MAKLLAHHTKNSYPENMQERLFHDPELAQLYNARLGDWQENQWSTSSAEIIPIGNAAEEAT